MTTIKQAYDNSVCYTHFVILLHDSKYSFSKILSILGWEVLSTYKRVYNKLKSNK